jgi:exonuclease III
MIKLISINIQGDMNHDRVIPFLLQQKSDVICLQEFFKEDLEKYEKALNMKSFFKPMFYRDSLVRKDGIENKILGVAIFSNYETVFNFSYIFGDDKNTPVFVKKDSVDERNIANTVLIWGEFKIKDSTYYKISTTHFTLTPYGESTIYQKQDASILIETLEDKLKDFILVGDLNAPRGMETFSMLASKFKDNIPLHYDSSIDPNLHRAKGLKLMVDGLFSTPEYIVSNVCFVEGISDHKAIVANITKIG